MSADQPATVPVRVQRRRTAGWRMPSGAVYVGRPTRWGKPYPVSDHGRAATVDRYRALVAAVRDELTGRPLACWCPLDVPCHADVLLNLANPQTSRNVECGTGGHP